MWWYFDLVIFFYLITVGAFFIETAMQWKSFTHRRLVGAITVVLAVSWLVIFYGSFVEPRLLVVRETTIALADQPTETLKVAVVSDLHLGPYKGEEWARRVTAAVNAQQPDLILLAGDFIFNDASQANKLEPLKDLKAPLGVYAVTGNHEYEFNAAPFVVSALERLGVTVLENERTTIDVHGRAIVLAGVSDLWNDGNPYRTLAGVEPEETVILLVHNPDVILSPNVGLADLIISGHTHGGQIRLPWVGPVPQIPNALGRAFDRGYFPQQHLFITSGVSEMGPRARLFNPPEIAVLNLSI